MYSRRLAIDKASLSSLEETQKTFLSHLRVGRLDSLISEEESLSSIFGHHGAALALRRCLTWTAFRPTSIHAGVWYLLSASTKIAEATTLSLNNIQCVFRPRVNPLPRKCHWTTVQWGFPKRM